MPKKKLKPIPLEQESEVKQLPKIGVECKTHGQKPGVTFSLDGREFGRFCFECYAITLTDILRKSGLQDFRKIEPTVIDMPHD